MLNRKEIKQTPNSIMLYFLDMERMQEHLRQRDLYMQQTGKARREAHFLGIERRPLCWSTVKEGHEIRWKKSLRSMFRVLEVMSRISVCLLRVMLSY